MIRGFGNDDDQPIRFYLYQDVLDELAFAARYETRPYAAILTGGFGLDDDTGFIEISGFTGAGWVDDLEQLYDALRPSADAWIQNGSESPIVGLFVAAEGGHARVDEEMARVHYSLFNIPFQPIIVLDPGSHELTVSARAPGLRFFNAAFRVVAIRPTASLNDLPLSGKRVLASVSEQE